MSQALLLDLDDTLIHNPMDRFLPAYFRALTTLVAPYMPPESFLAALRHATGEMMRDTDPATTNQQVFWRAITPRLTVRRETLEPALDRFYERVFPQLHEVTAPIPGSRALVESARDAGWRVVVATNPIFPRPAIHQRIEWAGLDPADFDLITTYENSRSTKPHPSYFAGIAAALGLHPAACVMAGNHLANDLVGAAAAGMRTFWVTHHPIADAEFVPDGEGTLATLRDWLFARDPQGRSG